MSTAAKELRAVLLKGEEDKGQILEAVKAVAKLIAAAQPKHAVTPEAKAKPKSHSTPK